MGVGIVVLLTGNVCVVQFPADGRVQDVIESLHTDWPDTFPEGEKVTGPEVIKLLFNGKFLEGNTQLSDAGVKSGSTPTFHVMVRPGAASKTKSGAVKTKSASSATQANDTGNNGGGGGGGGGCCTIM